jgi:hypothetical protein
MIIHDQMRETDTDSETAMDCLPAKRTYGADCDSRKYPRLADVVDPMDDSDSKADGTNTTEGKVKIAGAMEGTVCTLDDGEGKSVVSSSVKHTCKGNI